MSFCASKRIIIAVAEKLIYDIFTNVVKNSSSFRRMKYSETMEVMGSDKPDLDLICL